ncbi:CHAD domain-containing protein [Dethiosulfovibrio salsuginis]|uniref:CHAD domain-containing protein n=1 Tax=Dethiosulfovibrio salsuginis TaxID=561720 RepID=A0A1X7K182_9BACT|nr:CHAD domain-containing protein [Dethiosulfovibrio salsuginis]SMG34262.1 CHAD domain-containing protein [Dethiosulfovibrio salsuginis]
MNPSFVHQAYCGAVLLGHLDKLKKNSQMVAISSSEVEDLHRARVATRRIRSVLAVMSGVFSTDDIRGWSRDMRDYGRDLGQARDLDVRLQFISQELKDQEGDRGLARLHLRLAQERSRIEPRMVEKAQACLGWDIWDQAAKKLKPIIGQYRLEEPPFPDKIVSGHVKKLVLKVAGNDLFVKRGYDRGAWHGLRKDCKRLRYTLELYDDPMGAPFGRWLKVLKEIQDKLGEIHDMDLWIEALPAFTQEELDRTVAFFGHARGFNPVASGVEGLCQRLRERLDREVDLFIPYWDGLVQDKTWSDLINR